MSYTDVHDPLVFEGIHVAVLSGENGAGKSTLLDAITWALWGKARARTQDELVHAGSAEMEVDFEFDLTGQRYRVVRRRAVGRGAGTLLDLAVWNQGDFRSISGNSIAETERKITELLRMSYDTFISSSFVLQGRADSFTRATPTERKQVLADILELAEYDRLQDLTRDEVRGRDARVQTLEQQLRDDEAELERRDQYHEEQRRLEKEISTLDAQIEAADRELQSMRRQQSLVETIQREAAEVQRRVADAEAALGRHKGELAAAEAELDRLSGIAERQADIERGFARLTAAREQEEVLAEKQVAHGEWSTRLAAVDNAIGAARARIEAELSTAREHAEALADAKDMVARLEKAVALARLDEQELLRLRQRKASADTTLATTREQAAELRGANDRLRAEMFDLKAKIDTLHEFDACPLCQSALSAARKQGLVGEYNALGQAQKAEHTENRRRFEALEAQAEQLTADVTRLMTEIELVAARAARLAAHEQALEAARLTVERSHAAAQRAQELIATLERESFATDERERQADLRARIAELGYDPATHQEARATVRSLANFERLERELQHARQAIVHHEDAARRARDGIAEWQTRRQADVARLAELQQSLAATPDLRAAIAAADVALENLRRAHVGANQALGQARQRLAYLDFIANQRAQRERELARLRRERALYAELGTAFGKAGLQAMLIESAVPEIEQEANRLLAGMTDNRMHVTFQMQRNRRAGEGTIDTLDIVIQDELGARAYELYSGGEAFRVNFAIRIALSRLLASRAGARLQTLVIDEGFGSQDEEGRERLVDAIQRIADQFAMILIITHLDDLKERFPVRIDVRKTALGSVLTVDVQS
jgi:exonuclease SbcC